MKLQHLLPFQLTRAVCATARGDTHCGRLDLEKTDVTVLLTAMPPMPLNEYPDELVMKIILPLPAHYSRICRPFIFQITL